jgi:hypothetical protein
MSRKAIPIAAAVALCALLLVAAGCGGKKKEAATTNASPPATQTTSTTAGTTTSATTTESSGGGGSLADCKQFASAASKVESQFAGITTGNVDLKKAAAAFHGLAGRAPSAVRGDFATVDDAFSKIADALQGVDLKSGKTPDAATVAKLQKLIGEINQAKVTKAANNISAWASANCH